MADSIGMLGGAGGAGGAPSAHGAIGARNKIKKPIGDRVFTFIAYAVCVLFAAACTYPLLLVLAVSFSKEYYVGLYGYRLIPYEVSLETYQFIFRTSGLDFLRSFGMSVAVLVCGTGVSLLVTIPLAYALSQKRVKYRNAISFFCYFTSIFSAGLIPWYVTIVRVYKLSNSFMALVLPYCVSVFFLFVLRASFAQLPDEVLEAAKIDGAGELAVLTQVVLPLSVTPIVTIGFLYALQYWNDWYLTLLFISRREMFPLQFRLYSVLSNTEGLSAAQQQSMAGYMQVPAETVKMATTVLTIAPIVLLYPFVQRYFVQGITIGAVKG